MIQTGLSPSESTLSNLSDKYPDIYPQDFDSNVRHFSAFMAESRGVKKFRSSQLEGLGERCKLPQRGLGQSPSRQRFWCSFRLTKKHFVLNKSLFSDNFLTVQISDHWIVFLLEMNSQLRNSF